MRLVVAQSNMPVGDIEGNCERILAIAQDAVEHHRADLLVFPELALIGSPPEDLLLRPSFNTRIRDALERLQEATPVALVVGYPAVRQGQRVNVAGFIEPGAAPVEHVKQRLPNYRVFDERRYFTAGKDTCVINWQGLRIALAVGEDAWSDDMVAGAARAGADLLLNISASPFYQDKQEERLQMVSRCACKNGLPVIYCNRVGGQDELVFDGGSMVVAATGEKQLQAPFFQECLWPLDIHHEAGGVIFSGDSVQVPDVEAATWQALVLALHDYVTKSGFSRVVLGLSGGIDSALVLALAVEALGPDKVQAVMMPYHYTADMSLEDAEAEARVLKVDYQVLPVANIVAEFNTLLAPLFAGKGRDTTEENLQARCRGVVLMAISNKLGAMVLPTGNKTELAVGYATLYGDMVGGFAVLKDLPKTWVYRLARYYNTKMGTDVIPERVLTRPPSAELAPDQTDQDSLPDYDQLDAILNCYVERDMSAEAVIRAGHDRDTVYRVAGLVQRNEYKRHQAAPGPRVTRRAFGKDRRYPIANSWRLGD